MTLLVDTSVWSLALRRDVEATEPEMQQLKDALFRAEVVVTTGLILQELLQGFSGAKAQTQIIERFAALPLLQPDRDDHIGAAALRNLPYLRERPCRVGDFVRLCIQREMG